MRRCLFATLRSCGGAISGSESISISCMHDDQPVAIRIRPTSESLQAAVDVDCTSVASNGSFSSNCAPLTNLFVALCSYGSHNRGTDTGLARLGGGGGGG